MEDNNKHTENKDLVLEFLQRLSSATYSLSQTNEGDEMMDESSQEDTTHLIDLIARNLLNSCDVTVLSSDISNLPTLTASDPTLQLLEEDGNDDDVDIPEPYKYRRSDYLRKLLRVMAPISMNVAAHVCSSVLTYDSPSMQCQAILLLSHWLPVAPHLAPMVTEFLQLLEDPWKHADKNDLNTQFLVSEACFYLCSFYAKRSEIHSIRNCWDWTFLFDMLQPRDVTMSTHDEPRDDDSESSLKPIAVRWYSARVMGCVLDWKPVVLLSTLKRLGLAERRVPWLIHPWEINKEEADMQNSIFRSRVSLWSSDEFDLPSSEQIQYSLPASNTLANVGPGLTFYKYASLEKMVGAGSAMDNLDSTAPRESPSSQKRLILTPTTCRNLSLLGAVLCQEPHPPPILICGPHGSGKSSLARELLRLCRSDEESLLEFHIDEETDSKTLIGSYTTTDIPGEFSWRAGALTHATREGRWVLIEDLDSVPVEIQAALTKLLEDRLLPLGNGKYERCHPNFRIFGTCTTTSHQQHQRQSLRISANRGGGKRILSPSLWRKVHVKPLPWSELKQIASSLFLNLPESVIDAALSLLQTLDRSGREEMTATGGDDDDETDSNAPDIRAIRLWTGGRNPSVRDFFKVLTRISGGVAFGSNMAYTTEAQRTLCLAECVDIFVGSCPDRVGKLDFVNLIAAPIWSISRDLAISYVETRRPPTLVGADIVEIGRAKIHLGDHIELSRRKSETFAQTNHALRLMESVGVCIRENEPVLLVGETGCGKTTLVQQLAVNCERELIVQNLSLQTDSTDLLGGYKPLEIRNVARKVYNEFVNIFVATFSRKQNAKFLQYASSMMEKSNWKKLSQCFQRASHLGLSQMKDRAKNEALASSKKRISLSRSWDTFSNTVERFEKQRLTCDAGLAFVFAEGVLVDAIQSGKWVLLDEINLASSDTLQRLCGLLDDKEGSVTLTERGDASAIARHPNFRLFAAMNPATDAGKKDLPASIRSRFSELYVDELLDPVELRVVACRYLDGVLPTNGKPPEHMEIVVNAVDVYLKCRHLAETSLSDGGGHKPRYTLRSLSRALSAAKNLVMQQKIPLERAVYEGFQLSFEGALDAPSVKAVRKALKPLLPDGMKKSGLDHPSRRPGGKSDEGDYVLVKPFWIKAGPEEPTDWSEVSSSTGKARFILTPSVATNLRRLSRALTAGPWPVLLEGPTSAGKTTLVEYIAARCGHQVIRINNHEHTDVQEYTGSFAADQNGSLSFRDGLLVRALRRGHWVILDELNLAPSEVLEALNRLLDDNRELYLAETNETVKPHPDFRLFATQNPSGVYGGRKPLSRAFRNRFVEIHMSDIPSAEMITILEKRCACPPSHAKRLVDIMVTLRNRRSKSNVFLGKDSFITPRDLLRWAERQSSSKLELAEQGYMLLAERLRSEDEKVLVQEVLEEHLKVKLNMDEKYYEEDSEARLLLKQATEKTQLCANPFMDSIAATRTLLRLISLLLRCIKQKEPVLLVGDTGCGKTTVVQFLSFIFDKTLYAVNCHATTETSDLIGGLRPVRGRDLLLKQILMKLKQLMEEFEHPEQLQDLDIPEYLPLLFEDLQRGESDEYSVSETGLKACNVRELVSLASSTLKIRPAAKDATEERTKKRRKLSRPNSSDESEEESENEISDSCKTLVAEIEELGRRHASLFEWSDGPLVHAMKSGQMLLLDEMSLAEDAVLERLNSVLEPSRTLVLAEKGDDGSGVENRIVVAHDGFCIFATMNPGGDFGKRELSPALRSRFTEIWVPAVTARSDFELALGRTLVPRHTSIATSKQAPILEGMLTYVEWFNKTICADKTSPYADFKLTLRDVLSWGKFVVEARKANKDVSLWDAYCHGACLMHLDGFGLGAGLAVEDAATVKRKAEAFLLSQLPSDNTVSTLVETIEKFGIRDSASFGSFPFFIRVGPLPVPESSFNLTAPTTALNMFRVLRAMQLSKPVLLEGSPGVGKTSLIAALAAASGHKLVRINLSEQTDIADLMGSDLPVQSSTGGASFEWCDGILLTAIKEGSWVLLDELNLASQSVLEGLNSCLDHRASVYIPEIGKSFQCPDTFRVFAAQNPLAQGGGRKGLPKSFLNRFTKVFVDPLKDSDLLSIVSSKHPSFGKDLIDKMIGFNNAIHQGVIEEREYGSEGSPWEFNLRDVFRWCELITTKTGTNESYARDLYFQRFRTNADREKIDQVYRRYFGISLKSSGLPDLEIQESFIRVGNTTLARYDSLTNREREKSLWSEPAFFLSQLLPLEAVARCVLLRWPCLLVGQPASGKTSIISSLAEVCNVKLVEQCLSPSSDVTELVGCFEQIENMWEERLAVKELYECAHEFLRLDGINSQVCRRVWELSASLERCLEDFSSAYASFVKRGDDSLSQAEEMSSILLTGMKNCKNFHRMYSEQVKSVATKFERWSQPNGGGQQNDIAGHFVWRDGILVEAMTKGYWLVLENVNLCPSSVLDRLNSVMEKDGFLLLSECGTGEGGEGSSSHRLIRPHPNFRVFLTMNPTNGEISRAMRNRCVEVSLLQSVRSAPFQDSSNNSLEAIRSVSKEEKLDFLEMLNQAGARSLQLASSLQSTHYREYANSIQNGEEPPCLRGVSGAMSMLSGLLSRGIFGSSAVGRFVQIAFEIEDEKASAYLEGNQFSELTSAAYTPLPESSSVRNSWIMNGPLAQVNWDSRLLRLFMDNSTNVRAALADSELGLLDVNDVEADLAARYKVLHLPASVDDTHLRDILLQMFLSKMTSADAEARFTYLGGLNNQCSVALGWMGSTMRANLVNKTDPRTQAAPAGAMTSVENMPFLSQVRLLQLRRLPQQFREKIWFCTVYSIQTPVESCVALNVLDASFFIYETLLDRSTFSCPITPFFYPFFLAIDDMTSQLIRDCCQLEAHTAASFVASLSNFLSERDRLWVNLGSCPVVLKADSFLGFEETEFIVQWKWLKKAFSRLSSTCELYFSSNTRTSKQKVDAMVLAIDSVIFGSESDAWSPHKMRKKMIRPAVPHEAQQFHKILQTRSLSDDCTILADMRFNPFEESSGPVELQGLVDVHHPVFFMPQEEKVQILAALCTMHWSWTDEVGVGKKVEHSPFNDVDFYEKLRESFEKKRKDFIAEIAKAKVDTQIVTVENQFDVEMLESLKSTSAKAVSSSEAYARLAKTLLFTFGKMQISALAEFWCIQEEINISGKIGRLLLEFNDDAQLQKNLRLLLPYLKRLVDVVLSETIWSLVDMRAHQTLIWAIEGGSEKETSFRHLLRCLLPQILCTMSKHMWYNSFSSLNTISMSLELPNMWFDDDVGGSRKSHQLQEPCYASARLCHRVRSEFSIHMFGKQLAWSKTHESGKFHTMENHRCRLEQYRDIIKMLSSFTVSESKTKLFTYHYLLTDILEAVEAGSNDSSITPLVSLLRKPELLLEADLNEFKNTRMESRCSFSQRHLDDLVLPLLESMKEAWKLDDGSKEYKEQVALISVYLGLLRLNLFAPDSPLDPGRAPLAKISLIDRKLVNMGTKLTALRLDSGFSNGNFTPSSEDTMILLDEGDRLVKKRISQQKKVVERITSAPPFFEFYREVKDFLRTVSAKETVLQLIEALLSGDSEEATRRASNWLATATAFCERLSNQYNAYEDVTAVLVDSMHMIQDGMLLISESKNSRHEVGTVELFRLLLLFPMQDHSATIESLVSFLSSMTSDKAALIAQQKSEYLFSVSLAALTRLLLKKRLVGLSFEEISWCCKVFETLANSHLTGKTEKLVKDETIEDIQERDFREQFPNHRKDFHGLIEEDHDSLETEVDETEQVETAEDTTVLTDLQIELLCSMHRDLFSGESTAPTDSLRTLAFHSGYNAAYDLERLLGSSRQSSSKSEPMGSHVLAMALTALPKKGTLRTHSHLREKSGLIDFQNEPCPAEAMSAADPLERLMARTTQLLTAFPGHSILLGVGKVCEKVRKLDLMTTPIGKVMTGLEVILRQAQDWEQHASDRVRLGQALKEIGQLVASWRKLELESWSQLVRSRQDRQVFNAKKYLIRLHGILHNEESGGVIYKKENGSDFNRFTHSEPCTPRWIWKGFAASQQTLSALFEYDNIEDLTELVKALDTFILTSPLGEFGERLNLLESFSAQLLTEYNVSNKISNWKLQQSRAVSSICFYYSQFQAMLESKLEKLKAPIESKLKDEVKLAKWDEQSYYALAESSERNHRKLMKVLSEMDTCLYLNVGLLIQEDTYCGIRASPDTQDEFCATVPSNASMFPICVEDRSQKEKNVEWKFKGRDIKKQRWVDATIVGALVDSHLCKIEKYALKMQSMTKSGKVLPESWGITGSDSASSFCDAIFERIASLRTKSTRPMKERALVDLFRELKRNGFTTTKWAIPKQLRHMEHTFQLPKPKFEGTGLNGAEALKLERAEQYYARCLTELNAFRSETLLLGSKYMTTREMNLMVCLSESTMLMITQQRCLIANVIVDNAALVDCMSEMHFENANLPMAQSVLQGLTSDFDRGFIFSIESVKELSLLVRSSQNLLDTTQKMEWARDTIAKLESLAMPSSGSIDQDKTKFVTWGRLMNIEKKGVKLREAQSVLQECRKGCRDLGCFPLDVFDASNDCISRTLNVVDECKKMSRKVHQRGAHEPDSSALNSSLSSAVERLLIAFQNFCHESPISEENAQRADSKDTEQQEDYSILDCHKGIIERWANINLKELNGKLGNVIDQLRCIHDTVGINGEQREAFVGLVSDMNILSDYVQSLSKSYLQDSLKFYFSTSKFLYVILRVFRVLISKGYCADETSEEDDGDGEGDINGMTFEDDQDGTGMGEGEGKKDVTDQLENEDQLAGLKSDQDNSEDKPENQESKQLNEDEADQGMEMENDFDGDMCDLPDKEPDDEMEEQEGEEELDREMGEDASPDEQVVDERMWNESDDEDDINKEEEKFEKDSKVEGEAIEGETRTKEDDEGNDPSKDDKKEDDSKPDQQNPHGDDNLGDTLDMDQEDEEDRINEDNDNVEEQNGIDVQGNEQEQQDEENNDGDMQLDDDVCLDGEEDEGAEEPSAELDAEVDENQEDAESVGSEVNENQGDTEAPEDDDEVDPNNAITSQGQGTVEQDDEAKDENEPQEEPPEENALESMKQEPSTEEAHGIKSNQGTDAVMEDGADENNEEKDDNGEEDAGGTSGASQALDSQPDDSGQGGGYSERDGALDNPAETNGQQNADEIPNPFKDPGDASKFWHKKLNMVDSNPDNESEGGAEEDAAKEEEGLEQKTEGDFEYAPQEQKNSTQVLGEATEEEAKKLDQMHNDKEEEETEINETELGKKSEQEESQNQKHNKPSSRQSKKLDSMDQDNEEGINNDEMMSDVDDEVMDDLSEVSKGQEDNGDDEIVSGNLVGSDLSKLIVGDNEDVELFDPSKLIQDEQATGISSAEGAEARLKWLQIQGETHNLARRLCEKLRLVMEPLVASKLRGDYRTGKRINMKRVIGYIASGYRKDKIWLRRTKPAKRDYRVLLAVDDSESMKKSGAGDMALRAMATLAVGMNQLEIGELGIASFGEDMKLLHPYHLPFTSESGSDMVTNFKFNQQRTRTALCVESALASLEQYGDNSSMQLVFLISDGRIERDSRAALKRLMREMAERNILLAMIIVEGKNKKKDSIVHMKEVTFEKGKPVVKRFIEDYPFPYYIILEDMSALPEVLGDALKQWFEMLAQLNSAK